jgi:hypothetical protein
MIAAAEQKIPALKAAEAAATGELLTAISAFNHAAASHLDGLRANYDLHAAWFASQLESEAKLQARYAQISQALQRASPLVRESITCSLAAFHPFSHGTHLLGECVSRLPALRDIDAPASIRPGFWPPPPATRPPSPPQAPFGPSTAPSRTVVYEVCQPSGPYEGDDHPAAP